MASPGSRGPQGLALSGSSSLAPSVLTRAPPLGLSQTPRQPRSADTPSSRAWHSCGCTLTSELTLGQGVGGRRPAPVCALSQATVPPWDRTEKEGRGVPGRRGPRAGASPSAPGEDTCPEARRLPGARGPSTGVAGGQAAPCRLRFGASGQCGSLRWGQPGRQFTTGQLPETRCETVIDTDPTTASREAESTRPDTRVFTKHTRMHARSREVLCLLPRPAPPAQAPQGGRHTEPPPPGNR